MGLLDDFINTKTQESILTTKVLSNKSIEQIIEKMHTESKEYIKSFLHIHMGICAYIFQLSRDILPLDEMICDVNTMEQMDTFFGNDYVIDILVDVIKSGGLIIRTNSSNFDSVQKEINTLSDNDISIIANISNETGISIDVVVKKYTECNKNEQETISKLIDNPIIDKPIADKSVIDKPIIDKPVVIPSHRPIIPTLNDAKIILLDNVEYCTIKTSEFSKVYIKNGQIMYKRQDDQSNKPSNNKKPINKITGVRDIQNEQATNLLEFRKKAEHMFDD